MGAPAHNAIIVDGVAILGPSCRADCKLVALATYFVPYGRIHARDTGKPAPDDDFLSSLMTRRGF